MGSEGYNIHSHIASSTPRPPHQLPPCSYEHHTSTFTVYENIPTIILHPKSYHHHYYSHSSSSSLHTPTKIRNSQSRDLYLGILELTPKRQPLYHHRKVIGYPRAKSTRRPCHKTQPFVGNSTQSRASVPGFSGESCVCFYMHQDGCFSVCVCFFCYAYTVPGLLGYLFCLGIAYCIFVSTMGLVCFLWRTAGGKGCDKSHARMDG